MPCPSPARYLSACQVSPVTLPAAFAGSALRSGRQGENGAQQRTQQTRQRGIRASTFSNTQGATAFLVTGWSPRAFYDSGFRQTTSRGQEKLYEVPFPLPPAKLKNLFKQELSPEPLDRNLFELRVNQKQF